ncbi:hypothetical protein BJ878DRAFT_520441 [Calycina marina]|uniref:Rhodopsin domain-containing protein n=1 Tax=Calycina marina TaxID=1763456 RepID=A0A9P8CCC2_9HELO|nr:hypothetical protein BJ878DRAFT_520441 [Calycina marina]
MTTLLAESWTWYFIAVLVLIARYASRFLQLGSIKRFQAEDYVMFFVFVTYTVLVVNMNIVASLDTNLMMPQDIASLTPSSITSRIRGSKLVLVVEQSMIVSIWGCKVCLLFMYNKLTLGLRQQLAVKVVGGYVLGGFVLMEILYFGVWCRPFKNYWKVPVENVQCSAATHHLIVNTVLNISSDLMMLCIPLPLLIRSKIPTPKKLILCGLFGLAIFVILCAGLSKYYSFTHPFGSEWTFWYIREASTSILVANIPMCWSLLRRLFNVRSFNESSYGGAKSTNPTHNSGPGFSSKNKGTMLSSMPNNQTPRSENRGNVSWWERDGNAIRLGKTESEENIVGGKQPTLEIWESKRFEVESESVDPASPAITLHDGGGLNQIQRHFANKTSIASTAEPKR